LELPKRATVEAYRSHIKMFILESSNGSVDVSASSVFKKLDKFFKGLWASLKEAGKRETTHTPEIPAGSQEKIYLLFGQVLAVAEARGTDGYDDAVAKLPEEYRDRYHELFQFAAMFVLIMFDVRRSQEGFL
jgi:hypothetical protein